MPSTAIGDELHPDRHVDRDLVGRSAEHVTLVGQRGQHAGQRALLRLGADRDHVGEPGVEREVQHRPPARGQVQLRVQGVEAPQQVPGLGEGAGRRWVEPGELLWLGAPRGQLEGQPGQVDLGDLGVAVGRSGGVLQLRPEAVGDARAEAAGTTGALVGRCLGDGHGDEPGE